MSNVSDERLVIAAVKGDNHAIEELKERALSRIRTTLGQRLTFEVDTKHLEGLEHQIVEEVFNNLHQYTFRSLFLSWVHRITFNVAITENRKHNNVVATDVVKSDTGVKDPPQTEVSIDYEAIDYEIRSLVNLLNRSPYIQTTSSCSGHPDQEKWQQRRWDQRGGWIDIKPVGDPRAAFNFLVNLLICLDNTCALETEGSSCADTIRQRYRRVDADTLFQSGGPIAFMGVSLSFFACHPEEKHRLGIWKQFTVSIRELMPDCHELSAEVDTSDSAAKRLHQMLHRLSFMYSAELVRNGAGYPGIDLYTIADLNLLKRFSAVANRLQESLDKAGYIGSHDTEDDTLFTAEWFFDLRPFLNQELLPLPHLLTPKWEPRTREDHLKIWKLLELAVEEQLALKKEIF
ncbi:hypothetical protein C6499_02415 [Candidatus Poribacteria bacterium]|nr:MAG: hypothetical protein C6499_02415 [Candidatus Poribacteria bacterium]